jgi:hypothetical protein
MSSDKSHDNTLPCRFIPIFQEEAWNQQCKVFSDDIDRKLDHLGFNPLKEWLLRRLKALNDKLKKQNQGIECLEFSHMTLILFI